MQDYPLVRIGCNALSWGREFNNSVLSSRSIKWNWLINNEEYCSLCVGKHIWRSLQIWYVTCKMFSNPYDIDYASLDLSTRHKTRSFCLKSTCIKHVLNMEMI